MPGAPTGNTNASGARIIRDQMNYVLENYTSSKVEQGLALRKICENLVEKAIEHTDMASIQVIFDRVEGRPSQSVQVGSDPDNPFQLMIKEISGFTIEPDK